MNPEEIGKFIKDLRVKNALTQGDFAESLHVTAQAVSKWERGQSIPDISLLNEISQKYDVQIDEILGGKKNKKKNNRTIIIVAIVFLLGVVATLFIVLQNKNGNYNFRDVTSTCDEYKISGIAAYDANKSSIYISKIEYCGEEDLKEEYDNITCTLYEEYNDIRKRVSTCEEKSNVTLNDYLKSISIKVEDYSTICKDFSKSTLYLEIKAEGKVSYTHEIPLKITTCK